MVIEVKLKFKDTTYIAKFKRGANNEGLSDNNFWIDIDFTLKNEDIDFKGIIQGMSFYEIKEWNDMILSFLNGEMTCNHKLSFIRKIGEVYFYPEKRTVKKKLFLFDDVNKSYSIYFTEDEIREVYNNNQKFIDSVI